MRYFRQKDFNKCVKFLEGKPETIETQQELYKFMHEECRMMPDWSPVTAKNMIVYSKVYLTSNNPEFANWCNTMSDGSQVVWNRKHRAFYMIDAISMNRCKYTDYLDLFTEINGLYPWLLENWPYWWFREAQRELVAIWHGKYDQFFRILMK